MPQDRYAQALASNRPDSQRAIADFPQPVRTAVTAITGLAETSMVRSDRAG